MSSVLSSQGLVLATTMAISSTLVFLAFSRKPALPEPQNATNKAPALRSCLSSGNKKRDGKKKKVHFAENVEEEKMADDVMESSSPRKRVERSCRNQIPQNRLALYNGIRGDRVQRMACSY